VLLITIVAFTDADAIRVSFRDLQGHYARILRSLARRQFSIVDADDETHALIQLDELGDEPAELWQMESCLLDFELTERGTFRIRQFGEQTGPEIVERAYLLLGEALADEMFAEHPMEDQGERLEYGPEAARVIRKAVDAERGRVTDFQRTLATTEQGKALQRELGGSRTYIDAIVEQAAAKRLRRYKPAGNAKPS
jgi:hypothetical protein